MDAIKTAALTVSFAFAESVCCFVEIMFTTISTAVFSNSIINARRADPISKLRTSSKTGNSNATGINLNATANSMRKAISS